MYTKQCGHTADAARESHYTYYATLWLSERCSSEKLIASGASRFRPSFDSQYILNGTRAMRYMDSIVEPPAVAAS